MSEWDKKWNKYQEINDGKSNEGSEKVKRNNEQHILVQQGKPYHS